jgi:RNA polymerase sigma factor (sigma-70 family)
MPDRAEPDDRTRSVDERLRLEEALSQLPTSQRAVLVLRFFEGLSVQQTAEELGYPVGTVKSYSARGLDALRRVLDVDTERLAATAGEKRTA